MIERIDLSLKLDEEEYQKKLKKLQNKLSLLGYKVYLKKLPVVIVFEGPDAAGKGGCIKRITEKLDPRGFVVWAIAAPHGEDRTHQYLYRFWRRLPERGQIAIFDRSWYGRVLVERIEGFCTEEAWKRAYREINDFERELTDFGTVLVKFWLQISKQEQLKRFREREREPAKKWKITSEDWRNREKWDLYQEAAEEMLLRTSTLKAPWHIVEANDKLWARIKVLRILTETLKKHLQ